MNTVQKITFLGIGNVGFALADKLVNLGHAVTIAARDLTSATVRTALERNPKLTARPLTEAVTAADIVFLATPFPAAEAALLSAGSLSGKIVVDCTNPVGPGLSHGLNNTLSGGEFLQNLIPDALVVKAFTIYGFENFENSVYPGYGALKPAMLVAGNDASAKHTVSDLCRQLGWEPVDTGNISMSLHLEHMTLLWIKMARVQGLGAGFVWAMLRR
ncbi:MAG: NADPH-dependent F420 reductase [Blastocatellia bacterium]|nr:NADPH-dependent F420 reductase [Blastocatellia bacterium]